MILLYIIIRNVLFDSMLWLSTKGTEMTSFGVGRGLRIPIVKRGDLSRSKSGERGPSKLICSMEPQSLVITYLLGNADLES